MYVLSFADVFPRDFFLPGDTLIVYCFDLKNTASTPSVRKDKDSLLRAKPQRSRKNGETFVSGGETVAGAR